ncbi:unknown [Firmicutes bacterium CAG:822]|nr:unknown [Firmicutes bacterium CAG:822]
MTNYDLEESELIKLQILLSFVLLFTTIISITLSYDFLLKLEKKPPIYSEKESLDILIFNRTIMFIVAALFIYINIRDKNVKEKYNSEDEFANLQIDASLFNFIAAAIVLYVGVKSRSNITSEENPTI